MMRVFFGLEVDATTAVRVADWRDRTLASVGRPVSPSNFHITLAFIGPLSDTAIARLCLALDEWLARNAVCGASLHLDCTGYWPRPGIYWLGPTSWPEHLTRLARKLNSLGSAVGGKRERNPFQPHITLFRRCATAPPAPTVTPSITLDYQHCALFESRQGRQGVSYHVLQDWELPTH
ncbi:MAG TPA: RNA 2',3'-cyclic phosphodiesterase [Halioglobus sp.]